MSRRLVYWLPSAWFACAASFAVAAAPDVGRDNVSALQGSQRVAITEFAVEFYTQIHAEGRQGGADARVTSQLKGVGDADFQAVTDQAYADTVTALKAAGFEVIDPALVKADPAWAPLAAQYGQQAPWTFTDTSVTTSEPQISRYFTHDGWPAFFSSSVARGDFRQRVDVQNQGRGTQEGALAKSLNATLLHVHYLVGFAQASATKNNALFGGTRARAAIKTGNNLYADDTEWQFVTASGARTFTTSRRPRHGGAVYLSEPLVDEHDLYTVQESTTAADQKSDGVMNAVGGLLGGFGQKTKRNEAMPESAEAYRGSVNRLIGDTATAFAQALAAAR